jgi:hypothetical protein
MDGERAELRQHRARAADLTVPAQGQRPRRREHERDRGVAGQAAAPGTADPGDRAEDPRDAERGRLQAPDRVGHAASPWSGMAICASIVRSSARVWGILVR